MGSCYSCSNIAIDHIHAVKTLCNIIKPRQICRFVMVSNRLSGEEGVGWGRA